MADTRARKRKSLVWLAIVVVILCAIAVILGTQRTRGGAAGRPTARDTLAVFITDQLEGFREPYT